MAKFIEKLKDEIFNREVILYGLFGILTTVFNIGSFQLLLYVNIDYVVSNTIAMISTKTLAYILNKFFVFKSCTINIRELFGEIFRFIISRLFTMLVEFFGLIILVDLFKMNPDIGKYIIAILVVILNYFFGKKHVFKKDKTQGEMS